MKKYDVGIYVKDEDDRSGEKSIWVLNLPNRKAAENLARFASMGQDVVRAMVFTAFCSNITQNFENRTYKNGRKDDESWGYFRTEGE